VSEIEQGWERQQIVFDQESDDEVCQNTVQPPDFVRQYCSAVADLLQNKLLAVTQVE
jgi:hypothetical protein